MNDVITVKVGVLPGEIKSIGITEDVETLKDVFELAGFTLEGNNSIKLNGQSVNLSDSTDELTDGATLYATKMIKGN